MSANYSYNIEEFAKVLKINDDIVIVAICMYIYAICMHLCTIYMRLSEII